MPNSTYHFSPFYELGGAYEVDKKVAEHITEEAFGLLKSVTRLAFTYDAIESKRLYTLSGVTCELVASKTEKARTIFFTGGLVLRSGVDSVNFKEDWERRGNYVRFPENKHGLISSILVRVDRTTEEPKLRDMTANLIHEIGHDLDLGHCENPCVMQANRNGDAATAVGNLILTKKLFCVPHLEQLSIGAQQNTSSTVPVLSRP